MLPSISATLDDSLLVSDVLYVPPGQSVEAEASTSDLDDATLYLEVSETGNVYRTARDAAGNLLQIVGDGTSGVIFATLKNETKGSMFLRFRIEPAPLEVPAVVGEAAVSMQSPYAPVLDLSGLPEYADNAAALAAGEALGAAYADATGAIFRVIEAE